MTAATATQPSTTKATSPEKVRKGHLMAFIYWATVDQVIGRGSKVTVTNVDNGEGFVVNGEELVAEAASADVYSQTKKVTKTQAAEILVASHNRPFTVVFEKADGTDRTLRGRLVQPEPLLGRSMVEDLDVDRSKHRLRQVDHRTIKSLIVDGVKYTVK